MAAQPVTAAMVLDAIETTLWPAGEWVHVREAPQSADRQGRKLDLVAFATWASRGHQRNGVEVKVSASDWARERDNPAKAEWWWQHVDAFYVAAPVALAARIMDERPTSWGVIAVDTSAGTAKIVARPAARELPTTPLPVTAWLGMLRAAADCGPNALARAHQQGYDTARRHYEARAAEHAEQAPARAAEHAQLLRSVRAFERATGLRVPTDPDAGLDAETAAAARIVAALTTGRLNGRALAHLAAQLSEAAERVTAVAAQLADPDQVSP